MMLKKISIVFLVLILLSANIFCIYADNREKIKAWNTYLWGFDIQSQQLIGGRDNDFSVNVFDTGEIRIDNAALGTFHAFALASKTAISLDNYSISIKCNSDFYFSNEENISSWIGFTWATSNALQSPSTLGYLGNSGPVSLLNNAASSLSVVFIGNDGTITSNALVILHKSNGEEMVWSIPVEVDISQLTRIKVVKDSYFGYGYIIMVNGVQLSADGTGYDPINLSYLNGINDGFTIMSCSGGYNGQPGASLVSICDMAANSFVGSNVVTDSNGNIISIDDGGTTEPNSVTGDSGDYDDYDNPDSGDEGIIIAICLMVVSIVIIIVVYKRKK